MFLKLSYNNLLNIFKKYKDNFTYISIISSDRIIGLLIIYFIVRKISDDNFAFWTQVQFLPGLMSGILALGLGRGILRLLVDNKIPQKIISYTLSLIILIYLIICSISLLFILYLDNISVNRFMGGDSNTYVVMIILSIFIILEGFYEILGNFLRAKLSNLYLFFLGLKILPRIIGALLIAVFNFDFWNSMYFYLIGSVIVIIPLFFFVLKCIKRFHPKKNFNINGLKAILTKLTNYSFPILISSLSIPLIQILMRQYVIDTNGYDKLGVLAIYMSFIGMLIYFPEAFQSYIFPKLVYVKDNNKNLKTSKNFILNQLSYSLIVSIFFCMIFLFIGTYFLSILYPKNEWSNFDSLFISLASFTCIFYSSLQRIYLIYFPNKTIVLTYTLYISLALALFFLYAEFLSGPLNAVLSFMLFFLFSTLIMITFFKIKNIQLLRR